MLAGQPKRFATAYEDEGIPSFYVEICRARDRAELVTDNAKALKEQLEAVTGERIAALEGIGEMAREAVGKDVEAARAEIGSERDGGALAPREREAPAVERGKGVGMDLGL